MHIILLLDIKWAEFADFRGLPEPQLLKNRYLMIEILVGHNNLEKAMRVLKRKLIREGVFKELKSRRFYEKPSEKSKRKRKEAVKKRRKETSRRFN